MAKFNEIPEVKKCVKKSKFNPDRDYIRKAIEEYIAKGGEITYLGEHVLEDDMDDEEHGTVQISLMSLIPNYHGRVR